MNYCRKLRRLSTCSDDSGKATEDADSQERDTDHDSVDEKDACEEMIRKTYSAFKRTRSSL